MFSIDRLLIRPIVKRTQFPINTGKAKANPLTGRFRIDRLEVNNPDGYRHRRFLSLVEAEGRLSPRSLLSGKPEVDWLNLHLDSVVGVRSESGVVNVEEFRSRLEGERAVDGEMVERHRDAVQIKKLTIRIDRVETVDFSGGEEVVRRYDLNISREFEEVSDLLPIGEVLVAGCEEVGLTPRFDRIFASFLPPFLWEKIGVESIA